MFAKSNSKFFVRKKLLSQIVGAGCSGGCEPAVPAEGGGASVRHLCGHSRLRPLLPAPLRTGSRGQIQTCPRYRCRGLDFFEQLSGTEVLSL
jgi:hypothetical protein